MGKGAETAIDDERPRRGGRRSLESGPSGAREPGLRRRRDSDPRGVQDDPRSRCRPRGRERGGREGLRGGVPRSRQPRVRSCRRRAPAASPPQCPRRQGRPDRRRQRAVEEHWEGAAVRPSPGRRERAARADRHRRRGLRAGRPGQQARGLLRGRLPARRGVCRDGRGGDAQEPHRQRFREEPERSRAGGARGRHSAAPSRGAVQDPGREPARHHRSLRLGAAPRLCQPGGRARHRPIIRGLRGQDEPGAGDGARARSKRGTKLCRWSSRLGSRAHSSSSFRPRIARDTSTAGWFPNPGRTGRSRRC